MDLILGQPPSGLRRPIMLAGFTGWGDAGSAATIALRHVLGEQVPPASAMLDPSACYDFTVARPISSRASGGEGWQLEYPKAAFHPIYLPRADHDLLVLTGPEPHFRWPELAPAIISYARAARVHVLLTLGAYVGPVSHRVAPIARRSLDPALNERLAQLSVRDTEYEGPTAFATALLHAASAVGMPAASLWVATPPYLQAGNPVAALALLTTVCRLTALPIDTSRLQQTAEAFQRDVEAALQEHPELAEQLKEMLEEAGGSLDETGDPTTTTTWSGPDPDRPPPDAPPGLPTGKGLVEAVERYLRQSRGEGHAGGGPATSS